MKTNFFKMYKCVAATANWYCLLLLWPSMLVAQNGVTVSGLEVNAGTVTFNVSWNAATMPVTLWSDSVWVFVDYNNAGKMTRLPVTGITASAGTVVQVDGNDKGAWVIGNARDDGSFSATVQLLTSVNDVGGACVYGSNYPPVGEYHNDYTEISFTGTLPYDIVLRHENGSTVTVQSGTTLLLPCDYTLTSFSDATAAPGIMKCVPMTVNGSIDFTNPTVSKNQQASFVVSREPTIPDPASITYRWSAPDFSPVMHEGRTYTPTTPATLGTYSVRLTAQSEDYCPLAITKVVEVVDCHAPGSTVNFTAFAPCEGAATGTVWYLTDTRESNNLQTYKVKKMQDGHIWMVQDLKFGDKCKNNSFNSGSSDKTGAVSSLSTYYGNCTAATNTSTLTNRGYLYDWAATMNKSGAYQGSTSYRGCSGTASASVSACQGICPEGWHIPTGKSDGEFQALHNAPGRNCATNNDDCWDANSPWEGVLGGFCDNNGSLGHQNLNGRYWSSTYSTDSIVYILCFQSNSVDLQCTYYKGVGYSVRCVRNY